MSLLNPRQEAAAIFGVAVMGWAFPGVFVRLMPHLAPAPLVGLRLGLAWVALSPVLYFLPAARNGALQAVRNWRCWLLSLIMLVYYVVATPAFLYAPVGEVALVIASAPLFAVILRYLGRQLVTRLELLGAFLAITGVLIMAAPSFSARASTYRYEWIGVLLAIVAALAAAGYAIGNRKLLQIGSSPGAVVQVWLTFTLALLLLPSLATVPASSFAQPSMLWVIPLGALSTAVPTVAVAASSHRLSPVATTMINPLTSVCASLVAAAVIHEIPSLWTLCGGALVLGAVFTAAKAPLEKPEPAELVGD